MGTVTAFCASLTLSFAGLTSVPFAGAAEAAPTCKGVTATIWVNSSNIIVGGDDAGETYTGSLEGTSDNDVIVGTPGNDSIDGGTGDDLVCGGSGNDDIDGGIGDDDLCGDGGNDTMDGGIGDDDMCGDDGNDEMDGGIGEDEIDGGAGTDTLDGEIGEDVCINGESTDCEATTGTVVCGGSSSSSSSASSASSSSSTTSSSSAPSSSSSSTATSSSSTSSTSSSSTSSTSSSSSAVICPVTSDLIGHWKFDEEGGLIAFDSSGENNHGVLQNNPTYVAGNPLISPNASALDFDGTDDDVLVPGSDFDFGSDDFTVSTFLKTASGNRSVLGHADNNGSGNRGWGMKLNATGSTVNFFAMGDSGTNSASHNATLLDNQWHHVAGVYSRSGSTLTISAYVDGALVGSHASAVGDISVTTSLFLGRYNLPALTFDGTLDDVRIHDRVLSAAEIAACSAGTPASSSSNSSSSSSSTTSSSSSSSSVFNEGSSSSQGGSNNQENFSGFSTPEAVGGNGSYRGNRTNTLTGVANFLVDLILTDGGTIAPPAFGGRNSVRFSDSEESLICSMKKSMPKQTTGAMLRWTAEYLAPMMHRDADMIEDALRDRTFCKGEVVSAAPEKIAQAEPFYVNAAGYPVSSNSTWNVCVTGVVTLADIRANPDKDEDGNARDCSYYHTSGLWRHPDTGAYFTWDRKTKTLEVPEGYVLVKEQTVAVK